jgi:deoxyribodipyrimidine photo-lyase
VEVFTGSTTLMNEPEAVLTGQGKPYKVFGAYWRAAQTRLTDDELLTSPGRLDAPREWPAGDRLESWRLHPTAPDWSTGFDWMPGEAGAAAALDRFVDDALSDYVEGRDRPDMVGSSRLSPHLHWGEIGPRQIRRRLQLALHAHETPEAQAETFVRELGWRDFNHQLLFHHSRLASEDLDRRFDDFPWRTDPHGLEAWRRGLTGYPIVDAAMRQLWTTGWMHNRMRMVAASFLIKDLLIDWRAGEAWFWDTLVDADAANNAANWQWVAGSGADAQPFFRIFNPVSQGERHDPQGDYVRRWIPELACLPTKLVHQPWMASRDQLEACGVVLGRTYPQPIVDHPAARTRAFAALRQMRG